MSAQRLVGRKGGPQIDPRTQICVLGSSLVTPLGGLSRLCKTQICSQWESPETLTLGRGLLWGRPTFM